MKFPIRISLIWRPFMLFLGATPSNSYVRIDGSEVQLRFGRVDQTIARENVIGVVPLSWSFINGLGVIAGGQIFGLIGSTGGVVELQLRETVSMRFSGWPWAVRRIAVSLEDPQGFMDTMSAAAA
jgi:hypothetical protein